MTVKEIAEAVGKDVRSVRRWIAKAGDKVSRGTYDEVSQGIAHDYTLDETCEIIACGMGANAAGVFRASAGSAPAKTSDDELDRQYKAAIVALTGMVQNMDVRLSAVEKRTDELQALPAPALETRYYSIKGYAAKIGQKVYIDEARRLGMEARRLSDEMGHDIHKVSDEQFGWVNSYHTDVLEELFSV